MTASPTVLAVLADMARAASFLIDARNSSIISATLTQRHQRLGRSCSRSEPTGGFRSCGALSSATTVLTSLGSASCGELVAGGEPVGG
jgi:hypothetical protein